MSKSTILCPRRDEIVGPFNLPESDSWRIRGKFAFCSYCGSMHPGQFLAQVKKGAVVIPTDKNYKVYIRIGKEQHKAYFQHFSEAQRKELVELLNQGKVKFGYPGHFYVLPFFITPSK